MIELVRNFDINELLIILTAISVWLVSLRDAFLWNGQLAFSRGFVLRSLFILLIVFVLYMRVVPSILGTVMFSLPMGILAGYINVLILKEFKTEILQLKGRKSYRLFTKGKLLFRIVAYIRFTLLLQLVLVMVYSFKGFDFRVVVMVAGGYLIYCLVIRLFVLREHLRHCE